MLVNEFPPAAYTITLGELISNGLVNFDEEIWDFEYHDLDQRKRIYDKITDRHYYSEIACTPVGKWRHYLLDALNKRAPKANLLYDYMDKTDGLTSGDNENKLNRLVYSDFPQTPLSANQDFATSAHDFEEDIKRQLNSKDLIDIWDSFENPDEYLVAGVRTLFIPLLN